ncbi:nucleolar protein 4-like isoform X3 [Amphibalanus amphitrite]|uniref:nucleolar protein 4-like isoform X3 n=2 Tax=Amphibalanus amphitrite TaxID=1232801 RepID=UPI001C9193BF|nr:nucleolar protein 4-like isoform X3 [Amphibalanus amphitrite]
MCWSMSQTRSSRLSVIIEKMAREKEQTNRAQTMLDEISRKGGGVRADGCDTDDTGDTIGTIATTNGRLSPEMTDRSPKEDDSSSGNRDEEDEQEDDEDTDDREDAKFDPERLKAFNMFVRLFVDENLDRIVPISKQPKEKIQAIIDSCSRQFPEFVDRARKRLRTYLKSCRRHKRSRELAGLDSAAARASRPTPPHLTSVQAEQILAQACENESQNAKRMRLGLEPISQPLQQPVSSPQLTTTVASDRSATYEVASRLAAAPAGAAAAAGAGAHPLVPDQPVSSATEQLPAAGLQYQPNFSQAFGQMFSGMLPVTGFQMPSNGKVGDLFAKKAAPRPQLSPAEVAAVRVLVNGYRESANFLCRSADELELLIQQSGH